MAGPNNFIDRANRLIDRVDRPLTRWMARYGVRALRISVGLVFIWFGALKFFPEQSPAEELVTRTVEALSFGVVHADIALIGLATVEVLIGLGLVTGRFLRTTIALLAAQMIGTLSPLFLFPSEVWTTFPFALTLEGQYIFKNMVIIAAMFVVGATVRGGQLVDHPHEDHDAEGTTPPDKPGREARSETAEDGPPREERRLRAS